MPPIATGADLLVHLLSLSHRLSPANHVEGHVEGISMRCDLGDGDDEPRARAVGEQHGGAHELIPVRASPERLSGGAHDGATPEANGEGAAEDGGDEDGGFAGAGRFVWQSELCPASLATAARAALRTAATLMCAQEMQAARMTKRPSSLAAPKPGGTSAGRAFKPELKHGGLSTAVLPLPEESHDVWVEMVRLRRLRARLQKALPLQLALLSGVVGGALGVVQVWAEALCAAVVEPLQMLCQGTAVGAAVIEVLSLCLEHRRIDMLLHATAAKALSAAAAAVANETPAPAAAAAPSEFLSQSNPFDFDEDGGGGAAAEAADGGGMGGAGGWGEELTIIGDRSWYSPFVFEWLLISSREIGAWLHEALDEETNWRQWKPAGAGRHSRTLILLFRACLALVNSLRRLDVVLCGEAVSAAQAIADFHNTFAERLESAAHDAATETATVAAVAAVAAGSSSSAAAAAEASASIKGGRAVLASKPAGSDVRIGLDRIHCVPIASPLRASCGPVACPTRAPRVPFGCR